MTPCTSLYKEPCKNSKTAKQRILYGVTEAIVSFLFILDSVDASSNPISRLDVRALTKNILCTRFSKAIMYSVHAGRYEGVNSSNSSCGVRVA